jgi:hypothetical protein
MHSGQQDKYKHDVSVWKNSQEAEIRTKRAELTSREAHQLHEWYHMDCGVLE